jgi:hypothetical protein
MQCAVMALSKTDQAAPVSHLHGSTHTTRRASSLSRHFSRRVTRLSRCVLVSNLTACILGRRCEKDKARAAPFSPRSTRRAQGMTFRSETARLANQCVLAAYSRRPVRNDGRVWSNQHRDLHAHNRECNANMTGLPTQPGGYKRKKRQQA